MISARVFMTKFTRNVFRYSELGVVFLSIKFFSLTSLLCYNWNGLYLLDRRTPTTTKSLDRRKKPVCLSLSWKLFWEDLVSVIWRNYKIISLHLTIKSSLHNEEEVKRTLHRVQSSKDLEKDFILPRLSTSDAVHFTNISQNKS